MTKISILFLICTSLMAKEETGGWGLALNQETGQLRIGGRLQAIASYLSHSGQQDLYLRRARVNFQYQMKNLHLVYVELRNDKSNFQNSGERKFFLGDAFYEIPIEHSFIKNLTLFRSKVDISYSQTSSSKNLIHPDRSRAAEYAANYIVHNRRANNIQINGDILKLHYQLFAADGIHQSKVRSLTNQSSIKEVNKQDLSYGLKLRYFLWGDIIKPQETFYQATNTLSIGYGLSYNPSIRFELTNAQLTQKRSRMMHNLELSFSYGHFRILSEAFFFKNDLLNPSTNEFTNSWSAYMRSEYIINKFAPYIGISHFERSDTVKQSTENSQLIGLNYYSKSNVRRYGVSFQNLDYGSNLARSNEERITTYIMMNY